MKKFILIALSILLVGTIAACGNGSTPTSNKNTDPNAPKTVTDGANPQDLEPYKITWAYIGESYPDLDLVEAEMNKTLQEKYNVTLDILPLSWGEFDQKLTLMLSGDEDLDIVPVLTNIKSKLLNNGQILEIGDLLTAYGSNIKEAIGEENMYVCTINGKTYGVPVTKEYVENVGILMRKDLLDASGYTTADIQTLDDLEKIYAKVKTANPNMIMLAGRKGGTPGVDATYGDALTDSFGMVLPEDTIGKVVNYYESEQFLHNSQVIYNFAQKGYISKDCATTNDTRETQVKAGVAFSYLSPLKPGIELQDTLTTGYEMVAAPLTGQFRSTQAMTWIGWGIGRNSKYPERTMEVLDFMYGSSEMMNLFNWGIEGKHYVFADEAKGIITYPEGITAENKTYGLNIGYEIPNQYIAHVWEGNDPEIWEEYKKYNEAPPLISTGFIYDNSGVTTEISALTNVRNEYIDAIGSGAVDPSEAIPKFNEALKSAGLEKVMEDKQKQLDAFIKNKK